MFSAIQDVATEPMLFDVQELDIGQFPGLVRRVTITENSPELARMSEANAEAHRRSPDPESSDAAQRDSDRRAYRSLVASVINCAITDIQVALRQDDPRTLTINHRNRVKRLHNDAFDSAVMFFFGLEEIVMSDEMMRVRKVQYSSFNAYCSLMGWSAPVFRGRILRLFPRLEWFISAIVDGKLPRAPVVPVRDKSV